MKVLRVLGNLLLGLILFVAIFGLSVIVKTKSLLENDILHEAIDVAINEAYKDEENISASQKELIDSMFNDKESNSIITMVIDNYREYRNNSNYHVSKEDAEKLYNFILKYKDKIYELSGEDVSKMSEKEFKEFFNDGKIDEFAQSAFKDLDKEIGNEDVSKVLDIYTSATSGFVKTILIVTIVVCITLLCFLNWSLIKWMVIAGTDLIVSGVLLTVIYALANLLKKNVDIENFKLTIDFGGFLVAGIIEIVIGIVLVAGYVILKKTIYKSEEPAMNN